MKTLHRLTSRDVRASTTKCGRRVPHLEATIWWSRSTCDACNGVCKSKPRPVVYADVEPLKLEFK